MTTPLRSPRELVRHLRRNEDGVITLLTVFVLLGLTMILLGMINVARQIDAKVRRQNAADAGTRSAAGIVARGMNGVAFANHLEADVFAIAAFLHGLEGTETPWTPQYAPLKPLFEQMLAERAVSQFRSDLIQLTPRLAGRTMREIVRRHGIPQAALQAEEGAGVAGSGVSAYSATLWGWKDTNDQFPELPIDDLELQPSARIVDAITRRNEIARRNLASWIRELGAALAARQLPMPPGLASRANERLDQLLDVEYPQANIPAVLKAEAESSLRLFRFVGVVHGRQISEMAPRMYRNPLQSTSDAVAFAEARVFVPRSRRQWSTGRSVRDDGTIVESLGWITRITRPNGTVSERDNYDSWPQQWDTFNQNWTAQLVPATAQEMARLLNSTTNARLPGLGGLTPEQFHRLNTH